MQAIQSGTASAAAEPAAAAAPVEIPISAAAQYTAGSARAKIDITVDDE